MAKEVKEAKAPAVKTKETKDSKPVVAKAKDVREPKVKESREIKAKDEKSFFGRISSGIQRFFNETVGELRKVNWPTRREATNLTIVVLAVTFSMAIFLGMLDWLFNAVFRFILG